MNADILDLLKKSLTPYHAVKEAEKILLKNDFKKLEESEKWQIEKNGKYYVIRDGSALIAFKTGKNFSFTITASHTDSPCFKLKGKNQISDGNYLKFNVEKYGGGLFYSMLDIPLKIAGRIITEKNGKIVSTVAETDRYFAIPSVAIHFNRQANDGFKLNPQTDMQPLAGLALPGCSQNSLIEMLEKKYGGKILDFDLFASPAVTPVKYGFNDEFALAPRVDNLTSAFSSVEALTRSDPDNIAMIYLADNEEVGSRTKQGAGSTFLKDVTERISLCLGIQREDYMAALAKSLLVSADNAHAIHPNHPELSDKQNPVLLGGGLVIKHHACGNYTTDGYSSALVKHILNASGNKYQDFYMRSDLPCGGTLGAISSSQLSIRSVDVGMPQLAMHSACETFALTDYDNAIDCFTSIFNAQIDSTSYDETTVKIGD